LLRELCQDGAVVLYWDDGAGNGRVRAWAEALGVRTIVVGHDIEDSHGLLTERLDASPGALWVIRPDQHLAARFRRFEPEVAAKAVRRATTGQIQGAT
jgi:3-(3-hydroxy-phenyl)propionate hydroxylase